MSTKFQNFLRYFPNDSLAFLGCVSILCGLFVSRAMMSIGMMTLLASAIVHPKLLTNIKSFVRQPHLLLLSGYFLMMFLSFFWSEDQNYFKERIQIAIPFLVLPFAFHSMNRLDLIWYDWLFVLFIVLMTSGMSWSLFQYIEAKNAYDIGYVFSKVIPTPFKNDHIRFSIAVVLCIFICIDLFMRHKRKVFQSFVLLLIALFSIIYLHILAAKTGILAFYLLAFLFFIKLIFQKRYRKVGGAFLLLLILFPFLMYTISPSFRNKVNYAKYSIGEMRNDIKDPNISDEGRLISYKYAIDCLRKYPFTGVGMGDVYQQMKTSYAFDFPNEDVKVLLPHNQFLMFGMAIGIIGILYLIFVQISLFRLSRKHDFLYFAFCCVMLFAMMIEPLFETQYGTCMFLFFLLLLLQRRTRLA